ncbi:MAG: hypothetical protein ACRYG7_23225 [Janthinobacterium lividum]
MRKITFFGWHVGMRKIPFTHLLQVEVGVGLKEAHEATMRVLAEQPVTLEVPDELAARLLAQAEALGVKCRLEPAEAS